MNGELRYQIQPLRSNQQSSYSNGRGPTSAYRENNDRNVDSNMSLRGAVQDPNGKAILEGYREEVLNGFEPEKPRYNPVRLSARKLTAAANLS